jgi:hypothetical protein
VVIAHRHAPGLLLAATPLTVDVSPGALAWARLKGQPKVELPSVATAG